MPRQIIHVDMDAFYAAVEQRDDPTLRGQPVVVGARPGHRGVVSAASYEARAYGVRSAMSSAQAHRLCPQAVFLPVNMPRYLEVSRQIVGILGCFSPLLEQVSVDEAFLDVTGSRRLFGDAPAIGQQIKRRIRGELDLTASVGIAANKFVAKVASELGKPDGLVVVESGQEEEFLRPLPISRLWGVGKATEKRLLSLGIRTIGQLVQYPPALLERPFGAPGRQLHELARGRDDRPVVTRREAKSVSSETTFQVDVREREVLVKTLRTLAEEVAFRLRGSGLRGRTVQLKVRFADFATLTRRQTLAQPSDATDTIYGAALELLTRLDLGTRRVRLLGIGVSGFEAPVQAALFGEEETSHSPLDEALDDLRRRFGRDKIRRGRLVDGKG